MARFDFLSFFYNIIFSILFGFCCLVFFLTIKKEYEREKGQDLETPANISHHTTCNNQMRTIDSTAFDENELLRNNDDKFPVETTNISRRYYGRTRSQDGSSIGEDDSMRSPLKASEIKSAQNIIEYGNKYFHTNNRPGDGFIYSEIEDTIIAPQNEYSSANITGIRNKPSEQWKASQNDDFFLPQSLQHESLMECTEQSTSQDCLKTKQQSGYLITLNNDALVNTICLASLKLKRLKNFLNTTDNSQKDDFMNILTLITNGSNRDEEYPVDLILFDVMMKGFSRRSLLICSEGSECLSCCFSALMEHFFLSDYIDQESTSNHYLLKTKQQNGVYTLRPAAFSSNEFEDTFNPNIKKTIKTFKLKPGVKLIQAPYVFLIKPIDVDVLREIELFSELVLGNDIYYPKGMVLKVKNSVPSKYFACFFGDDNKTLMIVDENGINVGKYMNFSSIYDTYTCAVIYENLN